MSEKASALCVWQADKSKIVEMFSQQGEKVEMEHPVEARGHALSLLEESFDVTRNPDSIP